ncbi:hypothetical protein BBJ28_00022421 [Nothophytophthora sp. Chile5]|nr:hypothetical protein BBJ28_00022421 [Nothophytophthora sp. Chile5]
MPPAPSQLPADADPLGGWPAALRALSKSHKRRISASRLPPALAGASPSDRVHGAPSPTIAGPPALHPLDLSRARLGMMRDVSARFKYSEREAATRQPSTPSQAKAAASSISSSDDSENKPPPSAGNAGQLQDASAAADSASADTCPSRELLHEHIRRYYRVVEGSAAAPASTASTSSSPSDWDAVSARVRRDLAPYTVLKLGGFSLGDACTRLLGDVLTHGGARLRTLDLGFNRLSDKGATQLAQALESNASLDSLYLSGNEIGPAGAKALAQALTKNTHLRSLHLSGNNIGEDGARHLAEGVAGNSALRALYLGTNGIGAVGMQSLASALTQNCALEELTLGQNKVGSAGVRHLAAAFATGKVSLTTLELGKNGVDQDGAIALARALCSSTDNSSGELSSTNRLQNLYFDNNPLGDVGASAFGALLAQNTELRVLDLSYTQMSLLGLRELSVVGLARSRALLCLMLDGHDWASTQYMKKNHAQHLNLNGASLSTKGANNYAASCIVGAINANAHSALFKLTGVDLSFVVTLPPSANSSSDSSANSSSSSISGGSSAGGGSRKDSDTLTRNELILKCLHDARSASSAPASSASGSTPSSGLPLSHKRKPTDDAGEFAGGLADGRAGIAHGPSGADSGADSDAGESSAPVLQHPKFQKLEGNLKAGSSGSISSAGGGGSRSGSANALLGLLPPPHHGPTPAAGSSSPSKTSSNRPPRVIRIPSRGSLGRFPRSGGSCEKRLALKSPRYESTMEVHVRKIVADIAKLPFNADEYDTLQTYYLGGRCSTGESGCTDWGALKTQLEATKQATDAVLLVLLRQLHYLVGAFQNVENAAQTIDDILVSAHEEMDEQLNAPSASQTTSQQHTQ